MKTTKPILGLIATWFALATPAAGADVVANCSRLAAHPSDPDKIGAGIAFARIDPDRATEACLAALRAAPENGLVNVSLSRAYNKAEDYENSAKYARQAVTLDHPFAYYWMAIHYTYGDGVEQSHSEALDWSRQAVEQGVNAAARSIADSYRKGEGTDKDLNQALYWTGVATAQGNAGAYYTEGQVWEELAATGEHAAKRLAKAEAAYEKAVANGVSAGEDLARIRQRLRPNDIAGSLVMSRATTNGRMISGIMVLDELDSDWYLGGPLSDNDGEYVFARTRYHSSILTLWHRTDSHNGDSAWYVEFYYAGDSELKAPGRFDVSHDDGDVAHHEDLDISDPRLQKLAYGYRITARMTFRDVELLLAGTRVKIHYQRESGEVGGFTLALNTDLTDPGSGTILPQLIEKARANASSCCKAAPLTPFSSTYFAKLDACKSENERLKVWHKDDTTRLVLQNCDADIRKQDAERLLTYRTPAEKVAALAPAAKDPAGAAASGAVATADVVAEMDDNLLLWSACQAIFELRDDSEKQDAVDLKLYSVAQIKDPDETNPALYLDLSAKVSELASELASEWDDLSRVEQEDTQQFCYAYF